MIIPFNFFINSQAEPESKIRFSTHNHLHYKSTHSLTTTSASHNHQSQLQTQNQTQQIKTQKKKKKKLKFIKMPNPSTKSKSNLSFKSKTKPNKSKPPKKSSQIHKNVKPHHNSLHYQNSSSLWKISITSLSCNQVESVSDPSCEGHLGSFPLLWFTISSTCMQLQLSGLCFQWVTRRVWRL